MDNPESITLRGQGMFKSSAKIAGIEITACKGENCKSDEDIEEFFATHYMLLAYTN